MKNQCNKYAGWLADASIDELAPGHESELLAHAAECDACREAHNHAREVREFAAQIDRGVESLVSGETSPHFNSRLRARIAAEAACPRFNWRAWTPIAGAAVALAILLVAFVLRTPRPNSPPVAHNPSQPNVAARPANAAPAPMMSAGNRPPAASTSLHRHISKPPRHYAEPDVLVEPGQLAAVMQFAAAVRAGHVDGEELLVADQQSNVPIEIKPLEIAPLIGPDLQTSDGTTANKSRR